jgi:hypothetical protein
MSRLERIDGDFVLIAAEAKHSRILLLDLLFMIKHISPEL